MDCSVLVSCYSMTMLANKLPMTGESSRSFKCLPHPPYLPDLTCCDYQISGPLKEALIAKILQTNEDVHDTTHKWLHVQPNEFFSQ
ncbi:hypothetical protein Cfor_08666 [Coptotermes formosanus]|uniref:Uncharacterized protein n=1 Tax=Coptotermes formosanus TaxID=36987 RepID=A0A6L2PZX5_COPFO|nr:hypothetical protein Cfor_08666 [Coptotermes formosanus]